MCLKMYLFMALVYIAMCPGVTATDEIIVPQKFEEILTDFILQYHNNNTTDVCKTPVEKYNIKEDFTKSGFYEQLQLEKYFANNKCENLCLKVDYEFEEKEVNIITGSKNVTIVPEIVLTPTVDINIASTSATLIDENDGATNSETTYLEETISWSGEEEKIHNSQILTGSGTAEQTKQESEGGKKTAIIVAATVLAVMATAVVGYFVVIWVKTLLKSGTYVFPEPHNA